MKLSLLLPPLLVLAAFPASAESVKESKAHPHWAYEGAESPEHWGELAEEYAICRQGVNQSPIDFTASVPVSKSSIAYQYSAQAYKVENNGHTLVASALGKPLSATIGGKSFGLKQFHFHTPSEHTFMGKHFPMEVHFVHQTEQGELGVLGVVFKEGKTNLALVPLLAKPLKAGESVQLPQSLDIRPLLPKKAAHFRLNGSLTTPPCSEGVNWVVFKTPVEASKTQIQAMAEMIGQENNRPVQPLNARIVIEEK